MTTLKAWFISAFVFCLSLCCSLQGYFDQCNEIELELETGVRWDRIDEMVEVVDTTLIIPYASTYKQLKTLTSYVVGGRGFIDYNDWIVKGSGHYGWTVSGDFDQDHIQVSSIRGNTIDWSVGMGYALPVTNCFWFVPLIGYSNDELRLRVNETRSFDPVLFPSNIAQAHWTSSFYGPWIGFDILFDACYRRCYNFSFDAGYEFHYGWARTKWNQILITPPGDTFGYHTLMSNMMGHVFRFDTQYHLPCEWLVGIGLQYTHWNNAHKNRAHFDVGSAAGPSASQVQNTFKLNWQSFAIMANLTKAF